MQSQKELLIIYAEIAGVEIIVNGVNPEEFLITC